LLLSFSFPLRLQPSQVRNTTEVAEAVVVEVVEVAVAFPLHMAVAAAGAEAFPLHMAVVAAGAVAFPRLRVFPRQPRIFQRRGLLPRISRLLSGQRLILRQRRGRHTLLHRTLPTAWRRPIDLAGQLPHADQLRSHGIMSARM
jgi:hypothetical protein